MKRKHIETARFHARTELLGQFDWRDMAAAANEHKPTELSEVQREILRLHRQGLQVRDLALLFGMNDADVSVLIYGTDDPGSA